MKIGADKITIRKNFKDYPILRYDYRQEDLDNYQNEQLVVYASRGGGYYPKKVRVGPWGVLRTKFIKIEDFRTYENCCKYLSKYENRYR